MKAKEKKTIVEMFLRECGEVAKPAVVRACVKNIDSQIHDKLVCGEIKKSHVRDEWYYEGLLRRMMTHVRIHTRNTHTQGDSR